MKLKEIKVVGPEKAVAINVDKVVFVKPGGANISQIILDNSETFTTPYSLAETIKWLTAE